MSEQLVEINLRKVFHGRGFLVSSGGAYALIVLDRGTREVKLQLTPKQVEHVERHAKSQDDAVALALQVSGSKAIPDPVKEKNERLLLEVAQEVFSGLEKRLSALEVQVAELRASVGEFRSLVDEWRAERERKVAAAAAMREAKRSKAAP